MSLNNLPDFEEPKSATEAIEQLSVLGERNIDVVFNNILRLIRRRDRPELKKKDIYDLCQIYRQLGKFEGMKETIEKLRPGLDILDKPPEKEPDNSENDNTGMAEIQE